MDISFCLVIDAWGHFLEPLILKHKRVKLPDGSYFARSSTGAVIIPQENKGISHYTFCKKEGSVNFHKTKEGESNKHESVLELSTEDQKNMEEKLRQEVSKLDMKIDIKDQRFKYSVVWAKLPSFQQAFEALFQIDGGEVKFRDGLGDADRCEVLDAELCEVIEKHTITAKLEDIDRVDFQKAWLCTNKGKVLGDLRKKDGVYYLITNEQAIALLKNSGMQNIVDTVGHRVKG